MIIKMIVFCIKCNFISFNYIIDFKYVSVVSFCTKYSIIFWCIYNIYNFTFFILSIKNNIFICIIFLLKTFFFIIIIFLIFINITNQYIRMKSISWVEQNMTKMFSFSLLLLRFHHFSIICSFWSLSNSTISTNNI